MKFSEAIQRFSAWRSLKVKQSTVRGYDQDLRFFCLFLRNPEIEQITLAHLTAYLRGMHELGWDANSFIRKSLALRKFFEFYQLQGYRVLDWRLIPVPRKEYKIPRVADEENYRKLLNFMPIESEHLRDVRNRAIVNLLWDTGARNGEIVALNIDDPDFNRRRAIIKTEKSRGRRPLREIFWTRETNESLGTWFEKRRRLEKSDPRALFVCTSSWNVGERLTIRGLGEMLRRYCNRAGIPYMNAHSFRHRMGHELIKKGGSSADVMNILGHASLASSTIYTMMSDKELEERYRKLMGA